ncbi:MAG: substrate-binding domain-containing protein [Lachnospiraceae bacterium]|nr:substrate-binding domain-containing protein [Lachnospiraceae bacterium]
MKKRLIAAVSLAVCAAMGICACGNGDSDNVFTGEKSQVPEWQPKLNMITPAVYGTVDDLDLEPGTYISVIGKMENSPYWKQVQEGVRQAADDINEKLGYTGEDKVKVLFNAPSDSEDIDEQVNILDEEMSRYPDVIAIASIDEDSSAVQFDLAIGNGIPIVAFDSRNSYQGIQCTCMTDNTEAAANGAEKLCEVIGDSGEAALLVQDSVSGNAREREEAFRQELSADHPGVSIVETIYLDQLEEMKRQAAAEELGVTPEELNAWTEAASGLGTDPDSDTGEDPISEEAKTKLEDIDSIAGGMSDEETVAYYLSKHPELKGCFGTNADAVVLGLEALRYMEKSEDIALVGFDSGKEQLEALDSGEIDGLIVQNPFGMGYATVVAAARTILEIGNEAVVNTGYTWVDKENMEDEAVQLMLYE